MSDFIDELRARNAPPKIQPIQPRSVIEVDVLKEYNSVKQRLRQTSSSNGIIRVHTYLLLYLDNYSYRVSTTNDCNEDGKYRVRGRSAELRTYINVLKEYCAQDGIEFRLVRDSNSAYYRHLKETLVSTEEILTSTEGQNMYHYHAEFLVRL